MVMAPAAWFVLVPLAHGTRPPNSGRKKGVPNKISVEARTLASQLVNDVIYQTKLHDDFRRRRVHPTIEALIWSYHLGKPTQPIATNGSMALDVQARLDEERRVFASLDIHDLEQIAAESQALVDKAFAMVRANASPMLAGGSPAPAVFPTSPLASRPSSLPDVEITDETRGDAVASVEVQALAGEENGAGIDTVTQPQRKADDRVQLNNSMTSEVTTAPRPLVDNGDITAKPAGTATTTNIDEVNVPAGEP